MCECAAGTPPSTGRRNGPRPPDACPPPTARRGRRTGARAPSAFDQFEAGEPRLVIDALLRTGRLPDELQEAVVVRPLAHVSVDVRAERRIVPLRPVEHE